jgi:hypothetical protein
VYFCKNFTFLSATVFLFTPPFTQLNTPYPATAYLKGFLNTKNISSFQADLGIETILKIFSKEGLTHLFNTIKKDENYSANAKRIIKLNHNYINTIDDVVAFLQNKKPVLSNLIAKRNYLPEANRFAQLDDLNWAFGSMGVQDRAKHIATLYLEDISDLIKECVDEHFGFSRYAERLARSANSFDELYNELNKPDSFVDEILLQLLHEKIENTQPKLVCISVPFPGNLYAGLKCGKYLKQHFPSIKICLGGGFANTELRSLTEKRVFEFVDYITLDDGEAPIENLVYFVENKIDQTQLKRTFLLQDDKVCFIDNSNCKDYKQGQVGTPDYSDFYLDKYINAIEVVNPMHSLWSDGRWNKLTMAHGCYWGKCTFCDISLPYIKDYEPNTAQIICDRMEEIIAQTGCNGFHFVDEAAPPALMKAFSIEILQRNLVVTWWANIRFEKSFTRDLCLLLKAAGCIAVSGGLEVASDRLLKLIDKGITVEQVTIVNKNFTQAGIMVHAYLMYGFPTQSPQETIDSLEMIRQMFEAGVLQSAFWHLFTMTAHSPVGLHPAKFKVEKVTEEIGTFANNDIEHIDLNGTNHEDFGEGLKKSLFNYMHNIGFDIPLNKWFDFKVPKTTISPNYIASILLNEQYNVTTNNTRIVWIGNTPSLEIITKSKKGNSWEECVLTFESITQTVTIKLQKEQGVWFHSILPLISIHNKTSTTLAHLKQNYEEAGLQDFELFWDNKPITQLYKAGLLQV